jgi:hypothetical protein
MYEETEERIKAVIVIEAKMVIFLCKAIILLSFLMTIFILVALIHFIIKGNAFFICWCSGLLVWNINETRKNLNNLKKFRNQMRAYE